MRLLDVGREKLERVDRRKRGMGHFLSFFEKYLWVQMMEIGKEEVRQGLQRPVGLALYCEKDLKGDHMFHRVFVNNKLFWKYVNGASYVQNTLKSSRNIKRALAPVMSLPSPFAVNLYFHDLMFLEDCMQKKLFSTRCNHNSGRRIAHPVLLVMMAWNAFTQAAELERIQTALQG